MRLTQLKFRDLPVLLTLSFLCAQVVGTSLDTITPSQFLKDPQILSSSDGGVDDGNNTYYLRYTYANQSTLITYRLGYQGNLSEFNWDYGSRQWLSTWSVPKSKCDVYGFCGVFGSCDSRTSPICSCLTGFEPRNAEEWSKQNWTSGCARKEPLQCERVTNKSEAGNLDGFLKLPNTKVPDFAQWSSFLVDDCRTQCLQNCSCLAYAYDVGIGCMSWNGSLFDIQRFSAGATDLYIRVPYSLLGDKENNTVIIAVTVTIGTILVVTCGYLFWKRTIRGDKAHLKIQNNFQLPELSQFEFEKLASATNNFDSTNKLGQGGFGPVYKVVFVALNFNTPQIMSFIVWMSICLIHLNREDAANTRRIVGTYGYMSPEYAIQGRFSEKSDVFSFGVLLLEIVSRRKNTSFYEDAEALSLLGFAWKLWNDGNITSLIDQEISSPSFFAYIFRCIHIGLLCVQELARDRPTMTTVISMLTNETHNLPSPRQPAFLQREALMDVPFPGRSDESCSINYVSLTNIQGR
ncbi:hypothetical protein RJT34_13556 [Clitoria ternatea]|uniref:Apple domain-containing protein n=1 Tax=Clitoria ternatea TaxID=43366 RepID=A0AAN9JP70_CLITE